MQGRWKPDYPGSWLFHCGWNKIGGRGDKNNDLGEDKILKNLDKLLTGDILKILRKYDNSSKMNELLAFYLTVIHVRSIVRERWTE